MEYTLSWISGRILLQLMVENIVVSILLNDSANLGVVSELLPVLKDALRPLCVNLIS